MIEYFTIINLLPAEKDLHVLAIRYSNYHILSQVAHLFSAKLEPGSNHSVLTVPWLWLTVLTIGIGLAGMVFGLALYWGSKKYKNYLYYSFLCFALILAESINMVFNARDMTLSLLPLYDHILLAGLYFTEISVVLFFIFSFGINNKNYHIAIFTVVSVVFFVNNLDIKYNIHLLNYDVYRMVVFPYCTVLLISSIRQKRAGSMIACIGYMIYSLPTLSYLLTGYFYPPFYGVARFVFLLLLALVASRQVHEQQEFQQTLQLRAIGWKPNC